MSRKKKPNPVLTDVEMESFAAEGKSLAHVADKVLFVPFTLPGDVVDVEIVRRRRAWDEGRVLRLAKPSPLRTAPRCRHFGVCGGCQWQMAPYGEQLRMKRQQVVDQLHRIGGLTLPEVADTLGSERIYEYRNKLEFGCASKRWLTAEQIHALREQEAAAPESGRASWQSAIGFHVAGVFDKVLPIEECHLMPPLHNRIRNFIGQQATAMGMSFYDARTHTGLLRDIILRNSNGGCGSNDTQEVQEWMLIVQFCIEEEGQESPAMELLERVAGEFPELTSILWVNNCKLNDTFNDLEVHTYRGSDHITAHMDDLQFRISSKSFYQTNSAQAYRLYSTVRQLADLQGDEIVYDLYTGTGTIALFLARNAQKVVGIEYVPEAIEDAKQNARINGIGNVEFFAGDMKDLLQKDFIAAHGQPDVVITDPPRSGMHPSVVQTLMDTAPRRIVYVSCNPATQARDLALLAQKYAIEAVQPVDMFPHTSHVENVVRLKRIDN